MDKKESFLSEVLHCIRFPFDREKIRAELESHIEDRAEDYEGKGSDREAAVDLAVRDMGNAREIGQALNRQHNPVLGWIWLVTDVLAVLTAACLIVTLVLPLLSSLLPFHRLDPIPASDIIYQTKVDKKVKLDDMVIHISDVVYDTNGDLSVDYEYFDVRLWGSGWSFSNIGEISDNLGNHYLDGRSEESGGFLSRCRQTVPDFSAEANTLKIDYDSYNREYRLEIPLQAGEKK
mgnify:CR=1 FL=1